MRLSIVNVDRVKGNGHYAGKRAQEQVVRSGGVHWSTVRATQFFGFAGQVIEWTTTGGVAAVPPVLVQPVAVPDVAEVLVEVAAGPPMSAVAEVAGPDVVARRWVDRGDVITWFDLDTHDAPPVPTVNWQHLQDGQIHRIRVTFDPRPLIE